MARRLFEAEAQLLNRLGDHDQIPHLLAYFELNQEFFLVQDFVEGHSLEKEITVGKKHSEAYAIALIESMLEPLAFIHEQNVIHRDIKPANLIRRQQDGKVVLIDFGAVKELAATQVNAQGQTQIGTIIGTPGYMSSEQGRGKPKLSSDIYAAGMIVVQALTGKIPPVGYNTADELYEDPNTAEIIWHQDASVSPEFAGILDKMICYDFRQRYRSAMEVKQAIAQLSTNSRTIATTSDKGGIATVFQEEIPATSINIPKPPINLAKSPQGVGVPAPIKRHWARVAFRGFQRFIAVCFLILGLPISIYAVFEVNNMSVPKNERDDAMAALVILGLPLTGSGSWMLWSLHQRVRKEKFDSDWLRHNFYQVIEANQGEISLLKFAQTSRLSGKESQRYLEARVKEFNGDVRQMPDGETIYRFKL